MAREVKVGSYCHDRGLREEGNLILGTLCEVPGAGPRPLSDPTGPREPLG